jgi:iron complex transport system ATP-binding protein
MHALETHQLATGYGSRVIHSDLDLRVAPSQLVCLIGPNGAGKTTLLRTLSGTQRAIRGSVQLAGRNSHSVSSLERARLLSIVLTERVASGLLTGYELVAMGRTPHTSWTGALSNRDREIIAKSIEMYEAAELASRPLSEISDGERQRLMLARALAQEPRLLIRDEITGFLDLTRRMEMALLLRDIARKGEVAILMSTHDLDLAIRTADTMWLLPAPGQFHQGPPEELVLNGAIGKAFSREGVYFDTVSGGFQAALPKQDLIAVAGIGLRADWTRRAVARMALSIPETAVDATEDGFYLRQCGNTTRLDTLTALLTELRGACDR